MKVSPFLKIKTQYMKFILKATKISKPMNVFSKQDI